MTVRVVVTGIGLRSCLGNLAQSWQKLLRGESGLKWCQPFPELPPRPLGLISATPSSIQELTTEVVQAALQDAGLTPPLRNCGIVVGSSRSCQSAWETLARQGFSGLSETGSFAGWLETLPQQVGLVAAQAVGTQGIVSAPMAACATGLVAIAQAYTLLHTRQCNQVVVGAVESPVTPLTLVGFAKMGALAKTGCYPFDQNREGLVLGEGGAVFVLETLESATQRHAKIYGEITGFGLTCDATHLSAPSPQGKMGKTAIEQCLRRSGFKPGEIQYIHAHGTSTKLNDAYEADLIHSLFPPGVAISSTKGATGHTLGTSGALGVAFCLMALQQQVIPPCVGLQTSEFSLNIVKTASLQNLQNLQRALCFSFGFGGQNAVIGISCSPSQAN
jgi:3-oxoacyl-[acyl-carrier-protein] synthase II